MSRCMSDMLILMGIDWFDNVWVVEAKKEKCNSLRDRSCLISANISDLT